MDRKHLGRRRMLSDGLAFASACMLPGKAGAMTPLTMDDADRAGVELPASDDHDTLGVDALEEAACHAPFRAAFLAWFAEASGRFALPAAVDVATPSCTELRVPGLHPALGIKLHGNTDINVFVIWRDVFWDILVSMDEYAEPAPDGSGWQNNLLVPEAQRLHPTREACWREDGFEWLLRWLNDELAPATHLALCGGDGCYQGEGWTAARLVRDDMLPRTGRPDARNGPLWELLPLHAARA